MLEGKRVARRRAGARRGGADRDDARRHPGVRRPRSSSSTTARATRRPSARAAFGDPRVELVVHERNRGVGAAIVTGYKRALERGDRRRLRDGRRQPDGSRRPRGARRARRARRGRLREGEPALHGPGVGADPAHALPRQRRALDADEDRVRVLARRRLAVRLHGDRAARRSRCSTSTASTRTTASRTTCSCT